MFLAIRDRMQKDEEGFTLIELLVVVIIIGILAAIAIPAFLGQRERARRGAVQSDLRNMAVQAETFFTDEQTYTGFLDDELYTDYTVSDGVDRSGTVAANFTDTTFCLEATHDALSETWSYMNQRPTATDPQLDEAACP